MVVDEISDASLSFLISKEFTVMLLSSLLPRIVSYIVEEIEDLFNLWTFQPKDEKTLPCQRRS